MEGAMILHDSEIARRIREDGMIAPAAPNALKNCRYNLRAARAFSALSGDELILRSPKSFFSRLPGRRSHAWAIQPTEILVIMTRETVKIPADLMATYGQLNGWAQRGLSLVNTSMVEPGYSGPLSCFVVNFSRETAYIFPDESIAKMCFFQLAKAPDDLRPMTVTERDYARTLVDAAQRYPRSFLDVGGLEERVAERVAKGVNRSITVGGLVVVILIAWATLEPVVSRWLWEHAGVITTTHKQQIFELQKSLQDARSELEKARTQLETERKLRDAEAKRGP